MIGEVHIIPLLSLLSGLANVGLAAFVLGKDFHSRVNRWLAGLAVSFAFWGLGEYFMRVAPDPASAMFWVRFEALGYVGVGSLYLLFAFHYSDHAEQVERPLVRFLLWGPPVLFLALIWFTDGLMYTGMEMYHSWGNRPAIGPGFYPLVGYIALEWVIGAVVFARRVRSLERGTQRLAARYIFIGTILPIVVATLTAGIFPMAGIAVPEMATSVSILNAAILVFIIQRFRVLTFVPSRFADTLVASTDDAIVATDRQGELVYFSPAAERVFGVSADRILGSHFRDLFEEGKAEWENLRELVARMEAVSNYQIRMALDDGKDRTASLTFSALHDDTGESVGYVSVVRDVTEMLELQEQLMRSQRLDSLGSLAGGIAHDFNNILAIIMPRTQILQQVRSEDRVVVDHAERIERAVNSARDLVRRLLAFARGASHQTMVLSPNALIRDTLDMLERTLPRNVHLERELADDLPTVEVDHLQFEQSLVNLVLNGVDAMPGGGTITVRSERMVTDHETVRRKTTVPPGDWVVVSVRDTGTGIPAGELDQIFDPFFSTKPAGKGTGLGLAIVDTFVKSTRGFVEVFSQPGVSTTFELILPASEKTFRGLFREGPVRHSGEGRHVTLAESNEEIRDLLEQILTGAGYRVESHAALTSLFARLAQLRTDQTAPLPDLLLLQAELVGQEEDPFSTIRNLTPRTPVVLTTGGRGDAEDQARAQGSVQGILRKPFQVDAVLLTVDRAIQAGVAGGEPAGKVQG